MLLNWRLVLTLEGLSEFGVRSKADVHDLLIAGRHEPGCLNLCIPTRWTYVFALQLSYLKWSYLDHTVLGKSCALIRFIRIVECYALNPLSLNLPILQLLDHWHCMPHATRGQQARMLSEVPWNCPRPRPGSSSQQLSNWGNIQLVFDP